METRLGKYSTTSFQANLIAKARVKANNQRIDLYALNSSDIDFVNKLSEKLDLKSGYPHLTSYEDFDAWQNIIKNAFSKTGNDNVIIALHNKKPCGVMSFSKNDNQVNLSNLAKWRANPNEDVFHVGKILMHHLFDFAHNNNSLNISLYPANATPRGKSCKDFYSKVGFRLFRNNSMNLFGADYSAKAKELEQYFDYKKIENAPDINLDKIFSTII